jgi:hypothetical protein
MYTFWNFAYIIKLDINLLQKQIYYCIPKSIKANVSIIQIPILFYFIKYLITFKCSHILETLTSSLFWAIRNSIYNELFL